MWAKRIFDITTSLAALILLSPLLLVLAAIVKGTSEGPAIYKQERVGRHGLPFFILKFRTMRETGFNGPQITAKGDSRVTPIGRILRRSKLDELPQLFNVLRGDMSLVGPRPEVPRYVAHYPPNAKELIFQFRPGITDRASIELRDEESILASGPDQEAIYLNQLLPRKLELYCEYANTRTFWGDFTIILNTLAALFR